MPLIFGTHHYQVILRQGSSNNSPEAKSGPALGHTNTIKENLLKISCLKLDGQILNIYFL